MLDLSSVDLEKIANALADQTDYDHRWLIDPRTGQIAFWTSETGNMGAFRRYEGELHAEHPDLLPAWYAFRDARASRRAVQWLADNSLIDGRLSTFS